MATRISHWRTAWICLTVAIALHITDEALTGFLPVYNSVAEGARNRHPWILLPTFAFPVWLGCLVLGVVLLLALTPFITRGPNWIGLTSVVLALVMIGNALGHVGASLYWRRPAPGVYSSPVLFMAAVTLFGTALRAKVRRA